MHLSEDWRRRGKAGLMSITVVGLAEFTRGMKDEGREVEKLVSLVTRRISLDIFSRLILASPVDTGRFRGNWQMDVGQFNEQVLDGLDKSGQATIATNVAKLAGKNPFTAVYIENNLPYAGRLNDGWSKQAPAGFVETAIDQALLSFE
jgi:menaquinone-dependent protoporphyrinogen IX oxidase